MADLKAMFKAARDQRGSQAPVKKLTKEQIRELRARQAAETAQRERAAAAKMLAVQQAAKAAAAAAAPSTAPSTARASGMMPPPAPRAPKPAWAAAAPAAPAAVPAASSAADSLEAPISSAAGAAMAGSTPVAGASAAAQAEPANSAAGLPADFFQVRGDSEDAAESLAANSSQVLDHMMHQPAAARAAAPAASPSSAPGALPKGFFEDKDKDAKARGIVLPKKKDPNEEFKNFMESIDADVQDAEDVAAEEAAEEALERDQLDDFEQRQRVQQMMDQIAEGKDWPEDRLGLPQELEADGSEPARKKRKRPADVLQSDSESDDEDDSMQEPSLDWRARVF